MPSPQIYLVGGAVRDQLLKLAVTDRDWLVVGATPEILKAQGFRQVGKDFPVFLHPKTGEEYALARTERKNGHGYAGFYCNFSPEITLEQDLIRRDLTINAMAIDQHGQLYDPYNGKQDLSQKLLRHISPAFAEDPLRVLRVARFAARFSSLGFKIANETLELMQQITQAGELAFLTPERVWLETEKALKEENPQVYFQVLQQVGALAVLFPQLSTLFSNPSIQCETVYGLSLLEQVAKHTTTFEMPERAIIRFAALCYNFGKNLTIEHTTQQILTHQAVKQLCQQIKVPKAYQEFALLAVNFRPYFNQVFELKAEVIVQLFDQLDLWRKPQRLSQLCLIATVAFQKTLTFSLTSVPQTTYLKELFALAQKIKVQDIIADGFQHQAIKKELFSRRVRAIQQAKPLIE